MELDHRFKSTVPIKFNYPRPPPWLRMIWEIFGYGVSNYPSPPLNKRRRRIFFWTNNPFLRIFTDVGYFQQLG